MSYRASVHETLKESPYYALFGHDMVLPTTAAFEAPETFFTNMDDYLANLRATLAIAWEAAADGIRSRQVKQAKWYNTR